MLYKDLNEVVRYLDEARSMTMEMFQCESYDEYHNLSMELALFLERVTNRARNAVILTHDIERKDYMKMAAKELGIIVRGREEEAFIQLPYLLPKSRTIDSDSYIIEPLVCALQEFIDDEKPKKWHHVLVVIRSEYGPGDEKRIRDNDNIEIRHVLNVISSMLLVDDNRMDLVLLSRPGKVSRTLITVTDANEACIKFP